MTLQSLNVDLVQACTMEELALEDQGQIVQTFSITRTIEKKIRDNYEGLRRRYGETMAKTIIAAALVGCLSPIPGTSVVATLPFVGLAELIIWLRDNPKARSEVQSLYPMETAQVIRDLLKG